MLNELELAIHRCRRAGNAGAASADLYLATVPKLHRSLILFVFVFCQWRKPLYTLKVYILVPSPYTCLSNTADVRSSAKSAPFCAPQRLRSSDMSPAQAPGNSRLLLLQHGAVRHGSSSLLLLPWALMSYVWSLELDRECEPHRWSSSSTLCRVNNSTCVQGRRHTNQGML
jgi:hypothetical protein